MNKENLAKAEEIVENTTNFFNLTHEKVDNFLTDQISQALQEKDEAHQAEIARIREAMTSVEQTMHMTTAVIERTSPSDYQDGMLRMIAAFDSAVNQEPT